MMRMFSFLAVIFSAIVGTSGRRFRSMQELSEHHEEQLALANAKQQVQTFSSSLRQVSLAKQQGKGILKDFARAKLVEYKAQGKDIIGKLVKSSQFCTQVDIKWPGCSINVGFNFKAEEEIGANEDEQGRVTATVSLMFGGSVGVLYHASLWAQGDLQLSGKVPKKATWSGKDYDPKNENDMVFKPTAAGEAKDVTMGTKVFWLIKRWFRRKVKDILTLIKLGSKDTTTKFMELSKTIHEDLKDKTHDEDKKDGEETGAKAENAVDHSHDNSEKKLFKTLQYLHYKFYDMVQQFTIINKEKLLKGDLAVWANVIQSAFRKVYMGRCDYGAISSDENPTKLEKQGPAGATVCKLSNPKVSKMKCRKVDALWHSKFGQHVVDEKTTKAAMQLMCTFMKRGVLLDNPLGTGKGFTNLENMLKHPDAYPQLLLTKDNIVAAVTQILDQGKTLKRVFGVTDKDYKPIKDKTGKEIKYINNFGEKPHIVASEAAMLTRGLVLSYPPDKLKTEFLDKLQELRDIQNKEVQDQSCDMKAEASISLGLTIGESIVGFCTPDSNPFQAITTKKREWGQKTGSKNCELGDGAWKPLESTFSLVLASGTFYIDYHREGAIKVTDSHWGMRILVKPGNFALITPLMLCPAAETIRTFFRNLFHIVSIGGKAPPLATAIGTNLAIATTAPILTTFFNTIIAANGVLTGLLTELAKFAGLDQLGTSIVEALKKMFKVDLLKKSGIKVEPDVSGYISMNVEIGSDSKEDKVEFAHEQYFGLKVAGIPAGVAAVDVQGYLTYAMGVECKLGAYNKDYKAPAGSGNKAPAVAKK